MRNAPTPTRAGRTLLFRLLRRSGLPALVRATVQRRRVTIVAFHDPTPEAADRAFRYLAEHYSPIPLRLFLEACRRGDPDLLPPRPVVLTFDDGHRRTFELLPLIEKHGVPVTVFLCSGIVGTHRHFWFTRTHPSLSTEALKRLPSGERLARLSEVGFAPDREYAEPQALDRAQIEAMAPVIDFQSHTRFHPCLTTCTDHEARREIAESRVELARDYGFEVDALAYPNGDYSDRIVALVREAGYACALTVDAGFNTVDSDLYRLRRIDTDDADDLDELIVRVSGLWDTLKRLVPGSPRAAPRPHPPRGEP